MKYILATYCECYGNYCYPCIKYLAICLEQTFNLAITFWNRDSSNNCSWRDVPTGRFIAQIQFVFRSPLLGRLSFFSLLQVCVVGKRSFPCVCFSLRASNRKNYFKITRCSEYSKGHQKYLWK